MLQEEGERYAIVVIGGAALQLLGVISRSTGDVDMVAFADPPASRIRLLRPPTPLPLPPGFESRLTWRSFGALDVGIPGRLDCISLKLDAAADFLDTAQPTSNRHFADLVALAPTHDEFERAAQWVKGNTDDGFHPRVDHVVSLISHDRSR